MIIFCTQDSGSIKNFEKINNLLNKEFPIIKNIKQFNFYKKKAKNIITGTAAGNSLDRKASLYAKKNRINRSILFDSPTWISERILRFKVDKHKDFIMVEDKLTYDLCIKEKINKKNIFYLGKLFKFNNRDFSNILFISEPLKVASKLYKKKNIKDEYYYLSKIMKFIPKNLKIHIKLHPSEKKNKYKNYKPFCSKLLRNIDINKYKFSFGFLSKYNFFLSNHGLKSFIFLNSINKSYIYKAKKINLIYQDYQLKKNLVKIGKFVEKNKSQKNFLVNRLKIFLNI